MKKKNIIWISSLIAMMLILVTNSCKKNDNALQNVKTMPTVSATSAASNITATTASSGGNVTSDGGATITTRGVCWSITTNPTTSNNKTSDGTGTGTFTSSLTGLAAATNYYVRAYATNSFGTAYGTQVSFTSKTAGSVASLDSVVIGNQVWELKNLDVTTYRNGDAIPQVSDSAQWRNLTTGAWCYYNNDTAIGAVYGKLYNWYAVNDARGLAPLGWHIPTNAEWITLTDFLGGESVAGGKMKETGTMHWLSPNTEATNESGLTILPGGGGNGNFLGFGTFGYLWSSSEFNALFGWECTLYSFAGNVGIFGGEKWSGRSVRCLKD